jgi:hypothetical protein
MAIRRRPRARLWREHPAVQMAPGTKMALSTRMAAAGTEGTSADGNQKKVASAQMAQVTDNIWYWCNIYRYYQVQTLPGKDDTRYS